MPEDDIASVHYLHDRISNPFARDEAIARDPTTPPDVLDAIARKPVEDAWANDRASKNIGWAREFVAGHPRTSPDTLRWLASVPDDAALTAAVLKHPSTPQETLRTFIASKDALHWHYLLDNPAVDDEFVLAIVGAHPESQTLCAKALRKAGIADWTFETLAERLGGPWKPVVAEVRQARAESLDF